MLNHTHKLCRRGIRAVTCAAYGNGNDYADTGRGEGRDDARSFSKRQCGRYEIAQEQRHERETVYRQRAFDHARCRRVDHNVLARGAASLKICTLLDKPDRRQVEIAADYFGFVIPNEFVVGYVLDYAEKYRNLPDIGVLKPEVYA